MTIAAHRWRITAAAAAVIAAAAVAVALILASGTSGAPSRPSGRPVVHREAGTAVGTPRAQASKAKYGGIPSWLPKATVRVSRVVTATPTHPQLAIEGDTVAVHLPGGRAMVTAVGPQVPEEGAVPVPATSPCRFAVTLAAVHGSVPIDSHAFSFLSEHGQLHRARVTLRGGGRPPSHVSAGHPVTVSLSAVLPTGNGQLRWAPLGGRPVAAWDFDVEID
jgi:hypothetical protein